MLSGLNLLYGSRGVQQVRATKAQLCVQQRFWAKSVRMNERLVKCGRVPLGHVALKRFVEQEAKSALGSFKADAFDLVEPSSGLDPMRYLPGGAQ